MELAPGLLETGSQRTDSTNPWIYISLLEMDAPINVIVGDAGACPENYIDYAQFCSVMSVEWLESGTTTFSALGAERKKVIVEIALNNASNAEQVAWGTQKIGGDDVVSENIESVEVGKKILVFSAGHVTAAKRTKEGFKQFEPENGTVSDYSVEDFKLLFGELKLVAA